MSVDCIDRNAAISLVEEKQKALCPTGLWGRSWVSGSDLEKYDELDELISALALLPDVETALEDAPDDLPLEVRETIQYFRDEAYCDGRGGCARCAVTASGRKCVGTRAYSPVDVANLIERLARELGQLQESGAAFDTSVLDSLL